MWRQDVVARSVELPAFYWRFVGGDVVALVNTWSLGGRLWSDYGRLRCWVTVLIVVGVVV